MTAGETKYGHLVKGLLPKGVVTFLDRHGKQRWAYRQKGKHIGYFKTSPGTDEFRIEYESFTGGVIPFEVKREKRKADLLYFVMCGDAIKIGVTTSLIERMNAIQTCQPYEVRLLVAIPGGRSEERAFHERFARHSLRGEWFAADREIISVAMDLALRADAIHLTNEVRPA